MTYLQIFALIRGPNDLSFRSREAGEDLLLGSCNL